MASFIDNLDNKISSFGRSMLNKGKDVTDSVRLSAAIKESEEKQAEVYRKIGEYVFENYGETEDSQLQAWRSEILEIRAQAQQYRDQLNRLKNTVNCPNCGAAIPADSAFCSACGTKIEKPVQNVPGPQAGAVCPNCGASVEAGAAFCTSCGTRLQGNESAEETPKEEPAVCPNCGSEIKPGQMFCIKCGNKIC